MTGISINGQLSTKLYDKRYDFNFSIINFLNLDGNLPIALAYGIYISQLIGYARACGLYEDFLQRHNLVITKLLNQGFLQNRPVLFFKKFFRRFNTLLKSILSILYRWRKMVYLYWQLDCGSNVTIVLVYDVWHHFQ